MSKYNCINVLGMKVDMVQISEVIETMEDWIINGKSGQYIVISNVNDVVASHKKTVVKNAMNESGFSVPDGISLVLLGKFYGYPLEKRVYGPDLMHEFLQLSEKKGYSQFFYGSTESTLKRLISNLKRKFPKLKIAGSYSPPFRDLNVEEETAVMDIINNSLADVVWVGLGCPKQQLWMYKHRNKLKASVMVGVGAAFDFFAGTKRQAPRWMRDSGFEWLFRLITEPRRLWRRYLLGNTLFICLLIKEFMKGKGKLKKIVGC